MRIGKFPIDHRTFGLFCIALAFIGLLFSRALLSMSMIGLVINAVFSRQIGANWQRFRTSPPLLALTGIFLLYLLSGLNSENLDWWLDRVRMKAPFLFLPFAFAGIPRFSMRDYHCLLYGFFVFMLLVSLGVTVNYLLDYQAINELYKKGQVMPTPIQHIRFSLLIAFAVAAGWYFWKNGGWSGRSWERWTLLSGSVFLLGFLHLLSVRSGLLAVYGVLGYILLYTLVVQRRWVLGIGLLAGGVFAAGAAYRFVPTFKNKISYTRYTLEMIAQGKDLDLYSDSARMGSILSGYYMGRDHPWFGVGVGDILDQTNAYYQQYFPALEGIDFMPLNQFVFIFAATGILGLAFFSFCYLLPLFYRGGFRHEILSMHYIIFGLSFLVEHTIETQLGTAMFLLLLLLPLRMLLENKYEIPFDYGAPLSSDHDPERRKKH